MLISSTRTLMGTHLSCTQGALETFVICFGQLQRTCSQLGSACKMLVQALRKHFHAYAAHVSQLTGTADSAILSPFLRLRCAALLAILGNTQGCGDGDGSEAASDKCAGLEGGCGAPLCEASGCAACASTHQFCTHRTHASKAQ